MALAPGRHGHRRPDRADEADLDRVEVLRLRDVPCGPPIVHLLEEVLLEGLLAAEGFDVRRRLPVVGVLLEVEVGDLVGPRRVDLRDDLLQLRVVEGNVAELLRPTRRRGRQPSLCRRAVIRAGGRQGHRRSPSAIAPSPTIPFVVIVHLRALDRPSATLSRRGVARGAPSAGVIAAPMPSARPLAVATQMSLPFDVGIDHEVVGTPTSMSTTSTGFPPWDDVAFPDPRPHRACTRPRCRPAHGDRERPRSEQ